jgi:hypothetical protein
VKIRQKPNGFIIVASLKYCFYEAAHRLIDSLLDYYPEANIALFAHDEWTHNDPRCSDLYMVHDVPKHHRAKLWALNKTPFNKTVYLDADTSVCHDDIIKMFDFDSQLSFTNIRSYAGKITKFVGGEMTLHGGVFGYDSQPETLQFMRDWYDLYVKQVSGKWWPKGVSPRERLKPWDQFTLWFLVETTDINVTIYPDDARFNFVHIYNKDECKEEIVVWHYTIPEKELINERNIN